MIPSSPLIDFFDLTDGINTVSSSVYLKASEARDMQDVDLYPFGGFSKRNGYILLNSSQVGAGLSCTGLYMGRYSASGGTNIAYLVSGTHLYSMPAALAGVWTDRTGALTITSGQDKLWMFDQLNDIVVCDNNTDTPIQINSTPTASALSLSTLTTFLFPIQIRGYMWYFQPSVSGTIKYSRGYFSNYKDPTTVGTNNFVDVAPDSGDEVWGAVELYGDLFVFKRNGIYRILFSPVQVNSSGNVFPWIQSPIKTTSVGTFSHRSIVKFVTPATHVTPGQTFVFFVDENGTPTIFDGTIAIGLDSKIGYSTNSALITLSSMDMTRKKQSFSINYPLKNRLLCFMSSANSKNDVCWVLDYQKKFSICRYSFSNQFNCGALFEKSSGFFKPFTADYAGYAYELDSGSTDNGQPISDYYWTGDMWKGSPAVQTQWKFLEMRGQTGSSSQKVMVSYYFDGQTTPGVTDTRTLVSNQTLWSVVNGATNLIWGQGNWAIKGSIQATSEINMTAKTMSVKIQSNAPATDIYNLEGFSVQADGPKGMAEV